MVSGFKPAAGAAVVVASGRFVEKRTGVEAIGEVVPSTGLNSAGLTRDDVRTRADIVNIVRFILFLCETLSRHTHRNRIPVNMRFRRALRTADP
jgi:hypothetical protein